MLSSRGAISASDRALVAGEAADAGEGLAEVALQHAADPVRGSARPAAGRGRAPSGRRPRSPASPTGRGWPGEVARQHLDRGEDDDRDDEQREQPEPQALQHGAQDRSSCGGPPPAWPAGRRGPTSSTLSFGARPARCRRQRTQGCHEALRPGQPARRRPAGPAHQANHQRSAIFMPSSSPVGRQRRRARASSSRRSTKLLKTRTMTPPSSWTSCCISAYIAARLASSVSARAVTSSSLNRALFQKRLVPGRVLGVADGEHPVAGRTAAPVATAHQGFFSQTLSQ